ncbi:6-phosphogluconate dehydrogenase [Fusarium redolens]|uniref:phosphogluconate dehydrogenase (NADP(+)-dependent, decarboxylating) n=1 Tax=Fusarium redolens TaxID=48865 RepID=A0A9P9JPX4_FUSRE|nr:6-phosphogluconate dehydrogenase [Fusarium redolens]KAH7216954.1 6-phosphogluconate dehydrogenase [Fusarium redolens]
MKAAEKMVKDVNEETQVFPQHSYQQLCKEIYSENHPRIIIFSIPHEYPGDECVKALRPYMTKGDIVLGCSNEYYVNTERRQADLENDWIFYVGCGVSGGYQSARAGPSMSPGGDPQALEIIMPLLRTVAAKDRDGKPCTSPNATASWQEHPYLLVDKIPHCTAEEFRAVWHSELPTYPKDRTSKKGWKWPSRVQLQYDKYKLWESLRNEAAQVFWRELRLAFGHMQLTNKFLVTSKNAIGTSRCIRLRELACEKANIVSAHLFKCTSAEFDQRAADAEASGRRVQPSAMKVAPRDDSIEDLRQATYFCLLLCFTQGLQIIREMDQQRQWHINYQELLHVWSAGSIIQAGGIMDLLHKVYSESPGQKNNLLSNSTLENQLTNLLPSMKRCIIAALESDMVIPAMSQSLEYYKYSTLVDLPTQLAEAELDYFGNHKFHLKEEHRGEPSKGKHHFEWKPAKGEPDRFRL